MNNYEKIKTLTVEEMAKVIGSLENCKTCVATDFCGTGGSCSDYVLKWLNSEASDE